MPPDTNINTHTHTHAHTIGQSIVLYNNFKNSPFGIKIHTTAMPTNTSNTTGMKYMNDHKQRKKKAMNNWFRFWYERICVIEACARVIIHIKKTNACIGQQLNHMSISKTYIHLLYIHILCDRMSERPNNNNKCLHLMA